MEGESDRANHLQTGSTLLLQHSEGAEIIVLLVDSVIALGRDLELRRRWFHAWGPGSPQTLTRSCWASRQNRWAVLMRRYFREWMKVSRLYSVSYCCWSHSSPRPSRTDFMEALPEVEGERSPLSLFSPWEASGQHERTSKVMTVLSRRLDVSPCPA